MTPPPAAAETALLIQLKRIGDVLLCTPLARALKLDRPERRVLFLTEEANRPVLEGSPRIDRVLTVPPAMTPRDWRAAIAALAQERPSIVFDLSGTPRSCLLALASRAPRKIGFRVRLPRRLVYDVAVVPDRSKYTVDRRLDLLRAAGIADAGLDPELTVHDEERAQARALLDRSGFDRAAPLLAIAPASRREKKRWDPRGFAAVAERARQRWGAVPLVLHGPGEEQQAGELLALLDPSAPRLAGPPGLRMLAALLESSQLLLANDGGVKHLAVAVGTPSVTVFVSTASFSWHPPEHPLHEAVESGGGLAGEIERATEALERLWGRGPAHNPPARAGA